MAETDVERLLAGRKVINDYHVAHDGLHHRMREGRVLSKNHSAIIGKMASGLRELGFESEATFRDYNGLACGLEMLRCYRVEGTCDGCEGRERGCYPDCIEAMTYFDLKSKTLDVQKSYREKKVKIEQRSSDGVLTLEKLRSYGVDFFLWRKFPDNVPPNCAHKWVKVAEPRFDIHWRLRLRIIEPERYEKDKREWLQKP